MGPDLDPKDRIARNEAVFREVNERVQALEQSMSLRDIVDDPVELVEFFCECGDLACMAKIPLRQREYEEVRAHPARFFVAAGHQIPAVERVVSTTDRFLVVEKLGDEAAIAEITDPRAPE